MNNRTHRKLLIVDGQVAFTGGVGIADQWEGQAQDPEHWRDMHFELRGPAVTQFQAAFNDNWIKATGEVLNGEAYFPATAVAGEMDAHMFISSPSGGSESMHLMYLMAIAAADRSIDLEAAYFVPDELIIKSLQEARKRGVRVRVLVPGEHVLHRTGRNRACCLRSRSHTASVARQTPPQPRTAPVHQHRQQQHGDDHSGRFGMAEQ
jgi:cardiolipin synthase